MEKNRLYVLVSEELDSLPYKAVQAGHASVQWVLDNKSSLTWENEYLIWLQADNLAFWQEKLNLLDIPFTKFDEPDLDHMTTAIAINHNGNLFRNLKKLGE